ncbi:MAG TPA: glycoside hydrolase family 47 protein, partial [Pyrinomonadaceae bacterium]|nr:glycoside hydrolase family 47 protein [Pyrinomonadaceae bacterium]
MKIIRFGMLVFFAVIVASTMPVFGQAVDQKQMAAQVKAEFLHAWTGYKQYCWGHDDLKPISKTCRDWYGQTILMTPV